MRTVQLIFSTETDFSTSFIDLVCTLNPCTHKVNLTGSNKFSFSCDLGVLDLTNRLLNFKTLSLARNLQANYNFIGANDKLLSSNQAYNSDLLSFQVYFPNQTHLALGKTYANLICIIPLTINDSNNFTPLSKDLLRLAGTLKTGGSLTLVFIGELEQIKNVQGLMTSYSYQLSQSDDSATLLSSLQKKLLRELSNPYLVYLLSLVCHFSPILRLNSTAVNPTHLNETLSQTGINDKTYTQARANYKILGQELINNIIVNATIKKTTLTNSLKHLQLLLGERGTGKTTTLITLINELVAQDFKVILIAPYQREIYYHTASYFVSIDQLLSILSVSYEDKVQNKEQLFSQIFTELSRRTNCDVSDPTKLVVIIDEVGTMNLDQLQQVIDLIPSSNLILASTIDGYEGTALGFMHKLLRYYLLPKMHATNHLKVSLQILDYHFRDQADGLSLILQKLAGICGLVEFMSYQIQHYQLYHHPHLTIKVFSEQIKDLKSLSVIPSLAELTITTTQFADKSQILVPNLAQFSVKTISLVDTDQIYQFAKMSFLNHYRASSSDFEYMFRGEGELVGFYDNYFYTLLPTNECNCSHNNTNNLHLNTNRLIGGIQFITETVTDYSLELNRQIINRTRKPKGNLSLQTLIKTYGLTTELNPINEAYRISRIFIDPYYRNLNLTPQLLAYYLANLESKSNNSTVVDLLTVSFSYTPSLFNYWYKQGYVLLAISTNKTSSSAQYSLLVYKGVSPYSCKLVKLLATWQLGRLSLTSLLAQEIELNGKSKQSVFAHNHGPKAINTNCPRQHKLSQVDQKADATQLDLMSQVIQWYQSSFINTEKQLPSTLQKVKSLAHRFSQLIQWVLDVDVSLHKPASTTHSLYQTTLPVSNSLLPNLQWLGAYFMGKLEVTTVYNHLTSYLNNIETSNLNSNIDTTGFVTNSENRVLDEFLDQLPLVIKLMYQCPEQDLIPTGLINLVNRFDFNDDLATNLSENDLQQLSKFISNQIYAFLSEILSSSSLELLQLGTVSNNQAFYSQNSPDYQLLLLSVFWLEVMNNLQIIDRQDGLLNPKAKEILDHLDNSDNLLAQSQDLTVATTKLLINDVYVWLEALNQSYWSSFQNQSIAFNQYFLSHINSNIN